MKINENQSTKGHAYKMNKQNVKEYGNIFGILSGFLHYPV